MTTPTNFNQLPQAESTHCGRVVFGGVVSQMALSLKQLQGVKFRAAASYHVGRSTWYVGAYRGAQAVKGSPIGPTKGYTEDLDVMIATMPSSEWLAIEITYGCSGDPSIDPWLSAELYAQSATDFKHTKIDVGCKFEAPFDLTTEVNINGPSVQRVSTGAEPYPIPSGGWSVFTEPRPLYIPAAYRGQVLTLCFQTLGVMIYNVNVFDIYQEAT